MTDVIVLSGGASPEHAVSRMTSRFVSEELRARNYEVKAYVVRPDGGLSLDRGDNFEIEPLLSSTRDTEIQVISRFERDIAEVLRNHSSRVVLDLFHGGAGYDGRLQAVLKRHGAWVSSGRPDALWQFASKQRTKDALAGHNIEFAPFIVLTEEEWKQIAMFPELLGELSTDEVIVKPDRGGSSLGVQRCWPLSDAAVLNALQFDDRVIVEQFIRGEEFSCGAIRIGDTVTVLPPIHRGSTTQGRIYDFSEKYFCKDDKTSVTAPQFPNFDQYCTTVSSLTQHIAEIVLGLSYFRIDCIVDNMTSNPVLLEINAIPAMSRNGSFARGLRAEGIRVGEYFEALISSRFQQEKGRP